ncbi:MAG: DUF222 domain-containing protein [Actinomycetes bacterium]
MPTPGSLATSSALAQVEALLASVDHTSRAALPAVERLALVDSADRVARRADALRAVLIAEADRSKASMVAKGTPMTSYLASSGQRSSREAAALVFSGRDALARERTRDALLAGEVTLQQSRAINDVLGELPATMAPEQFDRAELLLLEQASHTHAKRLALQTRSVLEAVAPDHDASDDEQSRLEARTRAARRNRALWFIADGRGSVQIKGSLAEVDAAPLVKLVDAYMASDRRSSDGSESPSDLLGESRSPEQRRADALLALVAAHSQRRGGPRLAGDRPRVVVTMTEESLRRRAEQAGLLDTGASIAAGDLRRLCCDAEITPVVLGTQSEVLDLGATERLVTPPLRRALSARDGGCVFPSCDAADAACEAHHLIPWWAGGATALSNLVLLCPHHHGIVEPPRFWSGPPPDRWECRLAADGRPEFLPPRRLCRDRIPRRHERHATPRE